MMNGVAALWSSNRVRVVVAAVLLLGIGFGAGILVGRQHGGTSVARASSISPAATPSQSLSRSATSAPHDASSRSIDATPSTRRADGHRSCDPPRFPDSTCTGVPPGTHLTRYTGPCTITSDGTVIDAKIVSCQRLNIQAKDVIVRDSRLVTLWLDQDVMHAQRASGWSASVIDSEIDAGTSGENGGVCCGNYTLLRVDAHGGHNGAQCENGASYCRITDSWLHGQLNGGPVGTNHLGGFLHDGGTPATLKHNTIVCDHAAENGEGCSGDINLIANFGPMRDVIVQGNLLGANNLGSAYCTYAGGVGAGGAESYKDESSGVVYRNNVFERGSGGGTVQNSCAAYGPVTGFDAGGPGNVWEGNRYDDGTVVDPQS